MRNFSKSKKVVIKIGTNTLTKNNRLNVEYIANIAGQIATIKELGYQPLLVSSGAIGFGAREMGIDKKVKKTRLKQACAAIGQPILVHYYRTEFQKYNIHIAQVLLTKEALDSREMYVNLKTAVEQLLEMGVVPIFNENDSVSTSEIEPYIGDNDQLSAHIASKLDADLLIILTDVDALYDKNPIDHPDAKPISVVEELTDEIIANAGGAGSSFATGGMKTKIMAVNIARKAGCRTVLAHGMEPDVVPRILAGEELGTLFLADKQKMPNKSRWILNATPKGKLTIDAGAEAAIWLKKSLLPSGLVSVEGEFSKGDVIVINNKFKAIAGSDSSSMRQIIGVHSKEIKSILGDAKRDVISRSQEIVPIPGANTPDKSN
ncbi:MAG: glutamate 5-kinase [Deltaproteobacteria bacterium]|nr:glutamate 5-kinase [Deltaproteobacteria bacterium]MBN2671487.1 glutamate 5-kinase [Deltaproteobacteria bacterium]